MIVNPLYIRGATTRYDADAGKSDRSHITAYNGTADVCLTCTKKICRRCGKEICRGASKKLDSART